MDTGTIGALVGTGIGVFGGLIGTWYGIHTTKGPKERKFMIKLSIIIWMFVSSFLLGLFLLPEPFNSFLWVPYIFVLIVAIQFGNTKQQQIRDQESGNVTGPGQI